ncbi:MAG TPA: glycosyltransferase family 4 protein [Candidatus Binatia bacterium]
MGANGNNRALRVLHIDPERNWGGGEAQVFGLLAYLAERRHQSVLVAHPEGDLWARVGSLRVERRPLIIRNEFDLAAAFRLRQVIAREPFDIVHFHTKRAHALALWAPHGPARPRYVVTRRMDYPLKRNWYTHSLYNDRVDLVIAISSSIAEVLTRGGIGRGKIRVIHSGIDVDRFSAVPRSAGGGMPVIASLSIMEERKGQRYLLEAARLLKSRGRSFRYLLAGDGPLLGEYQKQAKDFGIEEDVVFSGWIDDVPAFLSAIDIFVMPSLFEGLGVAVLEAMAAGKPVVATNVGGLAESVVDSETGFLVRPRETAALAAAIDKLAQDSELARAMGTRGAERVRAHFSLARMAAENEACYYALVSEAAAKSPPAGLGRQPTAAH